MKQTKWRAIENRTQERERERKSGENEIKRKRTSQKLEEESREAKDAPRINFLASKMLAISIFSQVSSQLTLILDLLQILAV